MRTRKEIEEETQKRWNMLTEVNSANPYCVFADPTLEILLDIRDLLEEQKIEIVN